jgi:SWI/SNF-related matrix-associated actin-dependent regulator 1 of chromatin subfamily A
VKLRYEDWQHNLGTYFEGNDSAIVRQQSDAIQLAGTIIHELAHALVGARSGHNEDWREATLALGLIEAKATNQAYTLYDFTPTMRTTIAEAIARFCRENPTLIYAPDIEIPYPPGKLPAAFQLAGVREMLARPGNILLADEQGTGKTVEVCLYMNVVKPKRFLIICPNTVKNVWRRHLEPGGWSVVDYDDLEVAYTQMWTYGQQVIMSYEAATRHIHMLKKMDWDLVVFDEMHYLKNPSSKRSRACFGITGTKVIGCTGTPIVNYPQEIFPLLHYLDRDRWPEFGVFEANFGSYGNKFGRNLPQLNAILRSTIMTRRLKKDVLSELPRKRRSIIEFDTTPEIKKLIDEENKMWDAATKSDFDAVKMLNSLRNENSASETDEDWAALIEALTHTRKYAFEEMARLAHLIGLAKVPYVVDHVKDLLENRDKVVVFAHHRDVLMQIGAGVGPEGVVVSMGGDTIYVDGVRQKGDAVAAAAIFASSEKYTLFAAQISIAQGYSLVGSSTVVVAEQDWVPGVILQAEDRAHGIGRGDADAKSMSIQYLVFENSLDTHKSKLVIKKGKSIDRALNTPKVGAV